MDRFVRFLYGAFLALQLTTNSIAAILVPALLGVSISGCIVHADGPRSPNTCNLEGSKSGAPSCLPAPAIFCTPAEEITEQSVEQRSDPRFIAQGVTVLPSKHWLGPNLPVCPPGGTRLIQEQEEKLAREGAKSIGHRVGQVLTICELETERMTRQPDNIHAGWNTVDIDEVEAAYVRCTSQLDSLPVIPAYEDPHLAMAASLGFKEGYGDGVDEILYRLWAIEIAVAVVETAMTGGLELIEVAATRGIRLSLSVVRRMPIFIPGAIGGAGAFLKRAPRVAANVVMIGSSRRLGNSLKNNGFIRLIGEFAHHIVAHGDHRAKAALKVLEKYGVAVDDWVNGVYLPGYKTSPNPKGKIVHGNLHTDAYYKAVDDALQKATSKAEVIRELRLIAFKLEHGMMP